MKRSREAAGSAMELLGAIVGGGEPPSSTSPAQRQQQQRDALLEIPAHMQQHIYPHGRPAHTGASGAGAGGMSRKRAATGGGGGG
eukprot:SAG22_NODE_1537_length_4188_cov_108.843238_5_plen_84_part_01